MRRLAASIALILTLSGIAILPIAGPSDAAKPSLSSFLLSIHEFPVGWAVDNSVSSGSSGTDSLGCLTLSKVFDANQNKTVKATFADGNYPQLQENLVAPVSPKALM